MKESERADNYIPFTEKEILNMNTPMKTVKLRNYAITDPNAAGYFYYVTGETAQTPSGCQ